MQAARTSSRIALWTLLVLAVLSPWPFGGVPMWWVSAITTIAIAVGAAAAAHQIRRGAIVSTAVPLVGPLGVLALAVFHLVPLPPFIHALVAPGSARLWHPAQPEAAEVLGMAWRPVSIDPAATSGWIAFAAAVGVLAALGAPAGGQRRVAEAAAWVIVASGTLVAVYGIVARVLFGPLLYGRFVVPTVMPFGPFVNKNHFASYVTMAAIVALGVGWGRARQAAAAADAETRKALPSSALIAYGAAMAILIAVLLSLSRAGVLGAAAGVGTFFVAAARARRRQRSIRAPVAIALAIGALVLLSQLPVEVYGRLGTLLRWRQESSASFRLALWGDSVQTWRKSPWLGHGFGTYAAALPPQKSAAEIYRVDHAENDWLELAVEGGAAAIVLVALSLGSLVMAVARRIKACDRVTRGVVCGALGAAAGIAIHALFDFPFHIPASALLFATIVTLMAGSAGATDYRGRTPVLVVAGVLIAAGVALVLAGRVPNPTASRALALRAAETGDAAGRRLRLDMAEASVRRDIERRPADPESWLMLAWIRRAAGEEATALGLAAYALSLDPRRPALQEAVRDFVGVRYPVGAAMRPSR